MFGIDAEGDGYHGISARNALAMLHMLALLLSRRRLARRRVASGRSAGVPRPSLFRSRAQATRDEWNDNDGIEALIKGRLNG
jgi:hypothetical protein